MRKTPLPLPKLGIDMVSPATALTKATVRRAENVDIASTGAFSRRVGHSPAIAGDGFHSLFTYPRGTLLTKEGRVWFFDPDTYAQISMLCDMGASAPVDFTVYNEHLYLTNPGSTWWLPMDSMSARRVGVPLPTKLPTLTATAAGPFTAGTYGVGLSWVDDRAEESTVVLVGTVELATPGGVQLTDLEIDATKRYRIYMTPTDGDELYVADEFDATQTTYQIAGLPDGAQRASQHLAPMPAGDFIRGHAGRLYVAAGDTLWFSDALRPHLHSPRHGFIKFAERIRFIEPVADGIFVGDHRGTWFLRGMDPTKFETRLASPSRAIRRSSLSLPGNALSEEVAQGDRHLAIWLSDAGYMAGRSDGSVVPLQAGRISISPDLEGKSVAVERNGIQQVITLVAAPSMRTFGIAI